MGRIHSYQTLGTLDGPGVRFVVFLQGCPLRCAFCHNPDTWNGNGGIETSPEEVFQKVLRYRNYFGKDGGVTVTGGEALLQPNFVHELFTRCKDAGIHTALDTSGCLLNDQILALLEVTDLCLLDIKMTTEEDYEKYIGCKLQDVLQFLNTLEQRKIPIWIRQVIVPTINDMAENIERLNEMLRPYQWIEKIELLPFRKLCLEKYEAMGLSFPFGHLPEATEEAVAILQAQLNERR